MRKISPAFKQPARLYLLSLVNLWQRFGFYTMQGILMLYMVNVLLLSNVKAYSIFAAFSALLYLTPMLGGYVSDKGLGAKNAIIVGLIISIMGYSFLAIPGFNFLYMGLAAVILGTGLFMPSIAMLVSRLYAEHDVRVEAGFSIFYTAINIGGLVPPLITAFVIMFFGWHAVFIMAAAGLFIGLCIFLITTKGERYYTKVSCSKALSFLVAAIVLLMIFSWLLYYPIYANIPVFGSAIILIGYLLWKGFDYSEGARQKLLACLILIGMSIVFEVLYSQAAMSLTIYTEFNVNRHIHGWLIPTVMFRSLNPFYIIIIGPIMAQLWLRLTQRGKNPSVPVKFALGTIFMGLGFMLIPLSLIMSPHLVIINFWWIVLSYFLQTIGEMLVSPIGLSMVSELSPKKMLGLIMGAWYFATAVANMIAGYVSKWTTIPSESNNPMMTSDAYSHVFNLIGISSIFMGVIILAASRYIDSLINNKI